MADTKISALPASTTPLAGTEVVPLVQGGTTKKVSVSDLTAGRNVSMLQGNATNAFQVTKTGSDTPWVGPHFTLANGASGAAERVWAWQLSATDQYDLLNYDGTNWNRWFRFTSAGNLTPMAAGKGFNFTANTPAAGMTSQLLNAYEEGTFTATLTCGTSGTITLDSNENTLSYTRIGRVVYVSGQVAISAVSSPTGTVTLGTLPFAAASLPQRSESALFNVLLSNTTTNTPTFFGRINAAGATSITILAKDNTGALNSSPASLFAASDIWISGFYLV